MFYIYDSKDYKGDYAYALCMKRLWRKEKSFSNQNEAIKHVNSIEGIKFICEYDGQILYEDKFNDYWIDNNLVTIRSSDQQITGDFKNYSDCLDYSKKYIEKFIRENEPQQISMSLIQKLKEK